MRFSPGIETIIGRNVRWLYGSASQTIWYLDASSMPELLRPDTYCVAGTLLYAQPRVLRLGYCRRSAGRGRPQTAGQVAIEQMSADIATVEEVRVESIAEVLGQQR
jgi:hypothetical protein